MYSFIHLSVDEHLLNAGHSARRWGGTTPALIALTVSRGSHRTLEEPRKGCSLQPAKGVGRCRPPARRH